MSEDRTKDLKKILDETHDWPSVYLFKFILKGDNKNIAMLESLFSDTAKISTKESSGGKYVSLSIREVICSSDEVLEIYKKAKKIEGIIAL